MKNISIIVFIQLAFISFVYSQNTAFEGEVISNWDTTENVIPVSISSLRYSEIWGVARNGKEYAILGSTQGTHFIDVTNPNRLNHSFYFPGAYQEIVIHRDYHDYGCYLYAVCDEGPSTLQIMDMSQLPDTVTLVYDSDTLFTKVHNIFIDSMNARMYAFSVNGIPGIGRTAMAIYSLENPLKPILLGTYDHFGGISVSSVHDGYVRDNIAYLNCGRNGFAIIDYTDPEKPITLGTLTEYQDQGYNHSGWLSDDGSHYYLGDETNGKQIKSIDVSDPSDMVVDTLFGPEFPVASSITHNQVIACDYLYVSYYFNGLQVYDISEPAKPKRVMYSNEFVRKEGVWGVYPFLPSNNILISDMETGLYVIKGFEDNCKSKYSPECTVTLSAFDLNKSITNFELGPNPVNSYLDINFSLSEINKKEVQLTIIDISGKIVLEEKKVLTFDNNWSIDTHKLSQGFYVLKINNEDINLSRKIIISQ